MVDSNIEIGDIVLVSGLYGKDFIEINNKIGTIKKIIFSSSKNYVTYIVDVLINNMIIPINLAYIYKLDEILYGDDIYDRKNNEFILNPFEYYKNKFNIIGDTHLLVDKYGKSYLICRTRENNIQPIILTNLN